MKNILITGIGAPGAVSIIKHIKKNAPYNKIVGTDSDIKYCAAKSYVDEYFQISKATDENFLTDLLHAVKKYKIEYIISLVTDELHILSKNKDLLKSYNINIYISDYETIKIVTNKYFLYESLKNNINLPKYKLVELKNIFLNLTEFDYPNKNVCFKPLTYDGARGFRVITDKIDRLKELITQKPYNFYISIEELKILFEQSNYNCEVLLSEYLPGTEYTVDTFVKNNNLESISIRERIKLKDHISFVGKTVKNEYIENQVSIINSKFNFDGSIGYQFKNDEYDTPKLLECNPRLQGATILSCQNNYDYILANLNIPIQPTSNKLITMMRYFDEIFEYNI